jgi:serine/threonine protein phosphatase PrpC
VTSPLHIDPTESTDATPAANGAQPVRPLEPEGSPNGAQPAPPLLPHVEPATDAPPDGATSPLVSAPPPPAAAATCPQCGAAHENTTSFCEECGFVFAAEIESRTPAQSALVDSGPRLLRGRYELKQLIHERGSVQRFAGLDYGMQGDDRMPVVILRETFAAAEQSLSEGEPQPAGAAAAGDVAELPPTLRVSKLPTISWPGVEWERIVLERADHLSLPRVLEHFHEGDFVYVVEEALGGRPLREAWADPAHSDAHRYGWLIQIAEALHSLHDAGAMLEGLRPELISVSPTGQAGLTDLSDLLPIPSPADVALRRTLYTAPELIRAPHTADIRADLYGFGATIYALTLGRELTEEDFVGPGEPRRFLERFPDTHPVLGRVVSKTFCREPRHRFPAEPEASDRSAGIRELIRALEACRRNLSRVRMEIGAWTTTGMLRGGNEDALAVLHGTEGRLEDADEVALLILADGMGGVESGEVAAAIAVQTVRRFLLEEPPLSGLLRPASPVLHGTAERMFSPAPEAKAAMLPFVPPPGSLMLDAGGRESPHRTPEAHQARLAEAVREANRQVHRAATHGLGNRGMGCTLEAILIDGSTAVIGHVGDSRTYHWRDGKLELVTRDQTLVNRLVELGQITEHEAENHPRRSELQQAVGGRSEVHPDLYALTIRPGDWLVICSDGLSNQLRTEGIEKILLETPSAELAARRLVNRANLEGGEDNTSVIVVRVT